MSCTLKQLIERFRDEPGSSFHNLQYQVRIKHDRLLAQISREHGDCRISDIRARNLLAWHRTWTSDGKIAMAQALISRLRVLFRFGAILLEDGECLRLLNTLRETRFPSSTPRRPQMTVEQVMAVRVKAHWRGWDYMALAQALQFEFMLRQKDVIGEWVPVNEPGSSDVIKNDREKWITGLRWEEIDDNLVLKHRTGKDKDIEVNLRLARMVLEELALISRTPIAKLTRGSLPASGPVVLCEVTGWPYLTAEFRRKWRIVAKDAGIPDNIKNMDSLSAGMIFRGAMSQPTTREAG